MILYHGTNMEFSEILISRCRPNKDFGRGFYLTDIRSQAQEQAVRRCEFEGCGTHHMAVVCMILTLWLDLWQMTGWFTS